jgi:hypothetical protein
MKTIAIFLLVCVSTMASAYTWGPGSTVEIRFKNINHKFNVNDVSYTQVDRSKFDDFDKAAEQIATFKLEVRFKVCIDKEINGKVDCSTLAVEPIDSGSIDKKVLLDKMGYNKSYDQVQSGIDKIMEKRGLVDKQDEKLSNYHFQLNFYKQGAKASKKSIRIFQKKFFPSKMGNNYPRSSSLHTSSRSKITGYGHTAIMY